MFRSQPAIPAVDVASVPPDAFLLDVREVDEWECGHAPAAVHLPLSELVARIDEVPADRDVYVICKAGGRSAQAVRFLNEQGHDTVNVAGGMSAWAAAGKAMISQSGDKAFVA
jgi:rhodanese-related sulfurtransferase